MREIIKCNHCGIDIKCNICFLWETNMSQLDDKFYCKECMLKISRKLLEEIE